MRKLSVALLPALALLSAAPAFADNVVGLDFTPDTTRHLTDPTYIPAQGELDGVTAYTFTNTTGDIGGTTASRTYSASTDANTITQTFYYGLTNHLRLGVAMAYGSNNSYYDYSTGASTRTNSEGFSDPTFSVLYRLVDQNPQPISVDAFATYAPDLITNKGATIANSGSVAAGRHTANFGFQAGHETRFMTVQGVAGASWHSYGISENAATGADGETGSYWTPYLGINTAERITDHLSANLNGRYTFGSDNTGSTAANVPYTTNVPGDANVNVALNYEFIPNQLVASVTYGHDFLTNTTNTYASLPIADSTDSNRSVDTYGAHLTYAFY